MSPQTMQDSKVIELKADHITYFSENDETAFFEWVQRINCVVKFGGRGFGLSIFVNLEIVDQNDLRELLALFHRYNIDKRQLSSLSKPAFEDWFRDDEKYWHADVFGGEK